MAGRCYRMFLLGLLVLGHILHCSPPAQGQPAKYLVKDGTSRYEIVLRSDASPAERTAADELRKHIRLISGAGLPIVTEVEHTTAPMIAVGLNSELPPALSAVKSEKLAEEEILIKPYGDSLLLVGGSPRGTLYAVYEFLHQLGVRFYSPTFTKIPKSRYVLMPKAYRYSPPVRARTMAVGNGNNAQWCARNRLNSVSLWGSPGEEYGDGYAQGPDMHTFWRQMPEDMIRQHPNWAAEVDGTRLPPAGNRNWGLCLNPEVRAFLVQQGVKYAKDHPDIRTIWVGINDGSPYCQCAQCKAFYSDHGGSPSSLVLQLVNELADALAQECPGRMAKTIAYAWAAKPPTRMKARDNVVVMFCAPTDYLLPIAASPGAADIRRDAAGWRKVCANLSVYLYAYPADNYWLPTPCLYTFADNIKWALAGGINDIYMQVSGFMNGYGSEAMDMRAWAYSRLMWNPDLDFRQLIREYARDNYGPAADTVVAVIDQDHRNVLDAEGKVRRFENGPIVPDYVDPTKVRRANLMLETAHGSLKDSEQRKRLDLFRIPYLWADVWSGFTESGRFDAASSTWSVPMKDGELRNRYARLCKQFMVANKINALTEQVRMDPRLLAIDKMGVRWEAHQLRDAEGSVVVVPGIGGNLFELRHARSDFRPLKDGWMMTMMRYPLYGSWHDFVNDGIPSYRVKSAAADSIVLESRTPERTVRKSVRMTDGICSVELEGTRLKGSPLTLGTRMMFDMLPSAFGDAPEVYVEKQDGRWTKTALGEGLGEFWYAYTPIGMADTTGRILLVSETRREGVMITADPAGLASVGCEYDRYTHPNGFGHMFELAFRAPAGDRVRLKIGARIIPDARKLVSESAPAATVSK